MIKNKGLLVFISHKLLQLVLSIIGASLLIFFIVQLTPGNIAEIHSLSQNTAGQFHLNDPILVQYFHWFLGCLKFDFSVSLLDGTPVSSLVADYAGTSLILTIGSLFITISLAIPLSIILVFNEDSRWTKLLSTAVYSFSSIPVFVVGYIALAIVFGVFEFYPLNVPSGEFALWPWMAYYVMPLFVLAMGNGTLGEFVRVISLEIKTVNQSLYIKAARSRGAFLLLHFIKPVIIPFLSVIISRFAVLIGGVIVVERIFNRRGIGWLTWEATLNRDFYVIMSVTLLLSILIRLLMFLHEMLSYTLDPRLRK